MSMILDNLQTEFTLESQINAAHAVHFTGFF